MDFMASARLNCSDYRYLYPAGISWSGRGLYISINVTIVSISERTAILDACLFSLSERGSNLGVSSAEMIQVM